MKTVVQGDRATHTIIVHEDILDDALWAQIGANLSTWGPANGADFRTLGSATGWLRRFLRKPGWPRPTTWHIYKLNAGGTAWDVLLEK